MRGGHAKRIVLLAAAVASMGWSQSISSLQSSFLFSEGGPLNVTGITSGTFLYEGGFTLYINGTFNVNNFQSVTWLNLSTNVATTLSTGEGAVRATQIIATVPNALFATLVASPVQVKITVQESAGSASAFYTINPPLAPIQPLLPAGTVNVPYSTPYFTGGTAPFDAGLADGTPPSGLTAGPTTINGTPLQTGVSTFETVVTDFWGNQVHGDDAIEIVAVPTVTLVTPGSSSAGAGALTITVDGTNFVDDLLFAGETLRGSQVQWKAKGVLTPLTTTFVSSTRLTALVPGALVAAPVNAGIAVQQPSPAGSSNFPFAVLAPIVSTILPAGVPAGSGTITLTVNGANFTIDDSDNVPAVTLNGVTLATNFGNSGQLTATIPSNLLIAPAPAPTVTVTANQSPTSAGQPVTFTARVATPTTGTATGTVTFRDGATTLAANVAISGAGTATFTTSALTAGSHSITVVYNGDANFAVNTSVPSTQVVIAGSTAMTLEVTPAVPLIGTTATYKVTLTSAAAPPQGSVAINEGQAALCSIASLTPGAASSTGTCSVTYNSSDAQRSAGTHNLTASFTPALPNAAGTTAALSVSVVSATATASTPSSSNGNVYDYGLVTTFTSVVSPASANPAYTGWVNFYDGGVLIASATPSSTTGAASTPSMLLPAGSHSITAQYAGDFYYATSAVSAALGVTVNVSNARPYIVRVRNPGGATSNAVPFGVLLPVLSSLSANSAPAGSPDLLLTLAGVNFFAGSQVLFRGSTLTPSAVTSTTLTVTVPAALLATPGQVNVQVVNPGSALSNSVLFNVLAPVLSALQPAAAPAGSGAFTLTASGQNFVSGSQIVFNGTAVTPSTVTSTTLTATVPAALVTTPGQVNVQVANPAGAVSNSLPFNVLAPVLSALQPAAIPAGSAAFTLTATGQNFLSGSQIVFNGTAVTPSTVTGTTLTVTVPAAMLTTPGQVNVQVVNPGGTRSNILPFNVLPPGFSTLQPSAIPVGSAAFTLTASGQNFVNGSQIVFNGTALTSALSNGALSATVPSTLLASAGVVNVSVANPGGAASSPLPFSILSPSLAAVSPPGAVAGTVGVSLVVTGTNFVPGSQVLIDGSSLTTTFGSATSLSAAVPVTVLNGAKVATVTVANPGVSGNVTAGLPFTIGAMLSIATTALPTGVSGANYSAVLSAKGGTPPYTWSATGYPPALFINASTGVLSGVLQVGGTHTVNVTVTDAAKAVVSAQFTLTIAPPPVSISPSNVALPEGTVGVAYSGFVSATGGAEPYTFTVGGGALPDGLTLSSGGAVTGTPKMYGQFSFVVVVTDANRVTGSRATSITIRPAPLTVISGPSAPPVVGTPFTITFTGSGGVPPYRMTPCSPPPPGLSFSNGVLSGTPTTAGVFDICLVAADSAGTTVTKTTPLTITDVPPALTLGGAVGDGKVGVPYSGQITASGGVGSYTYSGSGLPDGLTLSSSGGISGMPTVDGTFQFAAGVTDSKGATASATFSITIAPADITILTGSLPDGIVGTVYSVTLSASGGNRAYTWTVSGLPDGLTASAAGVISGIPTTTGKSTVTVSVQDSTGSASARRTTLSLTILPPPLAISTTALPNGTAGAAYSTALQTSGGTAPYTYTATGLPAGLGISGAGVISGTPTAPGASTIVVTVKDAGGATVTKSFTLTVGLPPAPPLNFSGVTDTANPLQQVRLQVSIGSPYPVDVVVTLTLTFAPDSGPDDPSIQFSSGGRTARITIPAGATIGATDVGIQTGSVAGLITITSQMQAAGQDVTPSPAPRRTIRIAAAAPVIVTGSVAAVRNATGFTVTLSGYVTDREMTQAIFTFSGSNLTTTTLTVSIDAMFAQYFASPGAAATGSQFTFTQPFTVSGSTQSITSVTVTLVNRIGQSAPVTVNVN